MFNALKNNGTLDSLHINTTLSLNNLPQGENDDMDDDDDGNTEADPRN